MQRCIHLCRLYLPGVQLYIFFEKFLKAFATGEKNRAVLKDFLLSRFIKWLKIPRGPFLNYTLPKFSNTWILPMVLLAWSASFRPSSCNWLSSASYCINRALKCIATVIKAAKWTEYYVYVQVASCALYKKVCQLHHLQPKRLWHMWACNLITKGTPPQYLGNSNIVCSHLFYI